MSPPVLLHQPVVQITITPSSLEDMPNEKVGGKNSCFQVKVKI
jgi:hypothetical protein